MRSRSLPASSPSTALPLPREKGMAHVARVIVLLLATTVAGSTIAQPNRQALLVGNTDYTSLQKLRNPGNDVDDLEKALKAIGFTVQKMKNIKTRSDFDESAGQFGKRADENTVSLFYFSGHGAQADGKNYLIPTKASLQNARDVVEKGLDVSVIIDYLSGSRLSILILDACRTELNEINRSRGLLNGFSGVVGPRGTFIAYPSSPGSAALDGAGRNGLFTKHVLAAIAYPGLRLEEVFKRAREGVIGDAENSIQQLPWDASSVTGDFYFVAPPPAPPAPTTTPAQPAAPSG